MCTYVFILLNTMIRIIGSYKSYNMVKILRNCGLFSQVTIPFLYAHLQCMNLPINPHLHQHRAIISLFNTGSYSGQQHKRRLYTWTSPDGQQQNQIGYILCSRRWKSSIQSAKTRPGADCGSDHELLIAKFRLKLKKVEKTTRPFRYYLNQIPYDYTVELKNRFKGVDLIECLMNYGWRFVTLYRRQGSRPSPWKRNAQWQMVV